jgi:hypothetical protein
MVSNNELDSADYHTLRRIYDLGDIGLRSILGHQLLNENEKDMVKAYLSGAGIDNLMDQRFAITNLKESAQFTKSVAEYANVGLRKLEMEQKAAIMRLTAQRMEKDMGVGSEITVYSEDTILLDNLKEMMTREKDVKFPTFIDIQTTDQK